MSFDLGAYLARVGVAGGRGAGLHELHRAHVTSVPFENLDPRRGVPVSLSLADLERKLVGERRGGYCFEQNLLFKAALEAVGMRVEPMLARVRWGAPAGAVRPRSHLVLRVFADGAAWHADVGFGNGTPLEPLPFGPDGEQSVSGWRFRVVEEGAEYVLQTAAGGEWRDVYAFVPEPVPVVDIETSNWFTSTHPRSPFVTGLIAAAQRPDGTRVSLSDWSGELVLDEQSPDARRTDPVAPEQVPALLREHFGLELPSGDSRG